MTSPFEHNVKASLLVHANGVVLIRREGSGYADQENKCNIDFVVNADNEITLGLVAQRNQLLVALENVKSAYLAGRNLDLSEIEAAISSVVPYEAVTLEGYPL